jgi:hypothetical protein
MTGTWLCISDLMSPWSVLLYSDPWCWTSQSGGAWLDGRMDPLFTKRWPRCGFGRIISYHPRTSHYSFCVCNGPDVACKITSSVNMSCCTILVLPDMDGCGYPSRADDLMKLWVASDGTTILVMLFNNNSFITWNCKSNINGDFPGVFTQNSKANGLTMLKQLFPLFEYRSEATSEQSVLGWVTA